MDKFVTGLVVVSALINMHADRLLLAGKLKAGEGLKGADYYLAVGETNTTENLFKSAKLGGAMIACWMTVLMFLLRLPGPLSHLAALFYALFVGFNMLGHVLTASAFIMMKDRILRKSDIRKLFVFFMALTLVFATAYSGTLAYMGFKGHILMRWYHYLTLPILMVIVSQCFIAKAIKNKRIKDYAGTLGQLLAMLMTIHLVGLNT